MPLFWLLFIKFIFRYVPVCLFEFVRVNAVPAETTGRHQIPLELDVQVVSCLMWMPGTKL